MAPRFIQKIWRSKDTGPHLDGPQDPSPASPASPTAPSRPVDQASPRKAHPASTSHSSGTSSMSGLQEKIWNEAYERLRASEPKVVEAYEKILSAELRLAIPSPVESEAAENNISASQETRSRQMQWLVQAGLDRTRKRASVNQEIDTGLKAIQAVNQTVAQAVNAAPEAAVAWVGVCLGLEIMSNPVTESVSNRTGIAYILSRMVWYWNLVPVLLDKGKGEDSSDRLRIQLEKNIVLLFEKLLSYQANSVCRYYRHGLSVIGRDLLKIDDWAEQLNGIREAEAEVQRDMEQYNSEEMNIQLRRLNGSTVAIESRMQGVHSAIHYQTEQQEKRHHDDKDSQCLRELRETDPGDDKARIEDTKGGLLCDVSSWVLAHGNFRQWHDDPQAHILWIEGDAGKGKTMLLCSIINELNSDHGRCVAYFFCQAAEARLSNATSVLRGLIYLLVNQRPSLISHIRKKYDHAGKQIFEDGNAWYALSKIFTDMLDDPITKGAVLIVDALDECNAGRHQLLQFITTSSNAKWVVSSRNSPDIEEILGCMEQNVRIQLESNKDSISKSVDKYIDYKVNQLDRLKGYGDDIREQVRSYLASHSEGTFLWVALVYQELAAPQVKKRHTLAKLTAFPSGLDPFYRTMTETMLEKACTSDDARIGLEILAVASLVHRPISLQEMMLLVGSPTDMDLDDLEDIVKSCGSFLTLREDIVYFVHQSAKSFLLEKASYKILPSGSAYQNQALFTRSLEALSEIVKRDIYNLSTPGCLIESVSPPVPDPLASVRYSCVYWVDHLAESRAGSGTRLNLKDRATVHEFLKEKFLYWLECLSLLRSMSLGVLAIEKLEALVETENSPELTELLRDARRFILYHKPSIEAAPLQVYASALLFSPKGSQVRKLFRQDRPNWIVLEPPMEEEWNACLQTLQGHSGSLTSIAFSADSQQLVSASFDGSVKVWHAATGTCLQTIDDHGGSVRSVAFSADNRCLASASDVIKVWDTTTEACVRVLEGHKDPVMSIAFSEDGGELVSASDDGTVKVWDVATGTCLQTFSGYTGLARSVVCMSDGPRLALVSHGRVIRIWETRTGKCLQTLKGHGGSVTSIAFRADGQRLASASDDGVIKTWDAATGTCLRTFEGYGSLAISIAFSADSQRLASITYDRTIKVWDATADTSAQTLDRHGSIVTSVALSADGQRLASASEDGIVKVWEASSGTCLQTLEVGTAVTWLVFDSSTHTSLSTNVGSLSLDIPPATGSQLPQASREVRGSSYGISSDGVWIVKGQEKMLWLPPEYRASASATAGSMIAVGCRSGRVFSLGLV